MSSLVRTTTPEKREPPLNADHHIAEAVIRPLIDGQCFRFSHLEVEGPVIDFSFNSGAINRDEWNSHVMALVKCTGMSDKDIMLRVLCDLVVGNQLGQSTIKDYCQRFKIPEDIAESIGLREILPLESNPRIALPEQISATVDFLKNLAALGSVRPFEYQFTRNMHYRSFLWDRGGMHCLPFNDYLEHQLSNARRNAALFGGGFNVEANLVPPRSDSDCRFTSSYEQANREELKKVALNERAAYNLVELNLNHPFPHRALLGYCVDDNRIESRLIALHVASQDRSEINIQTEIVANLLLKLEELAASHGLAGISLWNSAASVLIHENYQELAVSEKGDLITKSRELYDRQGSLFLEVDDGLEKHFGETVAVRNRLNRKLSPLYNSDNAKNSRQKQYIFDSKSPFQLELASGLHEYKIGTSLSINRNFLLKDERRSQIEHQVKFLASFTEVEEHQKKILCIGTLQVTKESGARFTNLLEKKHVRQAHNEFVRGFGAQPFLSLVTGLIDWAQSRGLDEVHILPGDENLWLKYHQDAVDPLARAAQVGTALGFESPSKVQPHWVLSLNSSNPLEAAPVPLPTRKAMYDSIVAALESKNS